MALFVRYGFLGLAATGYGERKATEDQDYASSEKRA
jgi:hypothetical protein